MSESASINAATQADLSAFATGAGDVNGISYEDLVAKHGSEATNGALVNLTLRLSGEDALNSYLGTPVAAEAREVFNEKMAQLSHPTTAAAQADIDALYEDLIKSYAEEAMEQQEEDLAAAGNGEKKASTKGQGAEGLNWLIAMAKAMGKAAGEYLGRSVELGLKMAEIQGDERDIRGSDGNLVKAGSLTDAEQASMVTELQAEMQANTQMFKMVFEAAATAIKTFGEAFSTMARKQ